MFLHVSAILFREGVSVRETLLDREPWTENPLPDRDPLYGKERAVRILLECILVIKFAVWIKFVLLCGSNLR